MTPSPDFTTARESLNDEIADFIHQQTIHTIAAKPQGNTMHTNLFKPPVDHIGGLGADKCKQHGWADIESPDYELCNISKQRLWVDHTYQRSDLSEKNITAIAGSWDWHCCGCLVIGKRGDKYVVIEGQHRLHAAMKRREITELPCIVFRFKSIEQEARAFLAINTMRKCVSSMDKHRAGSSANDADILATNEVLAAAGVSLSKSPSKSSHTKGVGVVKKLLMDHGRPAVLQMLTILKSVAWDAGIPAETMKAVCYLQKNIEGGIDGRFVERLINVGGKGISRAEAAGANLGLSASPRWKAVGILEAVNHSLKNRYTLKATA